MQIFIINVKICLCKIFIASISKILMKLNKMALSEQMQNIIFTNQKFLITMWLSASAASLFDDCCC